MSWDLFAYFAAAAALLWAAGAVTACLHRDTAPAALISAAGSAVLLAFIVSMWISVGRPPMRTMGETRLWYSLFLSVVGIVMYRRRSYRWMLVYGSGMALVFLCINLFKPEIHTAELMPALQSIWFVPHVTVYMFSYALLGAATIFSLVGAFRPAQYDSARCDALVRMGWAFLSLGMGMGALWAKTAWGDWWSWDPKETWALATWLGYLLYLHSRSRLRQSPKASAALLLLCFLLLCMCWFGVNWLPSAKGVSIHSY